MTHKISDASPATDANRLPPAYQPMLAPMTFQWIRVASQPVSGQIRPASLPDNAWYQLLETHLANTDDVQVEIPLPGLGRLELALMHQGQALHIDVTGGDPAAQSWLLQHRAPIERRLQAKTGRAMFFGFARRKGLV